MKKYKNYKFDDYKVGDLIKNLAHDDDYIGMIIEKNGNICNQRNQHRGLIKIFYHDFKIKDYVFELDRDYIFLEIL